MLSAGNSIVAPLALVGCGGNPGLPPDAHVVDENERESESESEGERDAGLPDAVNPDLGVSKVNIEDYLSLVSGDSAGVNGPCAVSNEGPDGTPVVAFGNDSSDIGYQIYARRVEEGALPELISRTPAGLSATSRAMEGWQKSLAIKADASGIGFTLRSPDMVTKEGTDMGAYVQAYYLDRTLADNAPVLISQDTLSRPATQDVFNFAMAAAADAFLLQSLTDFTNEGRWAMSVFLFLGGADGVPNNITRFPSLGSSAGGYGPFAISGDGLVVAYTDEDKWTFLEINLRVHRWTGEGWFWSDSLLSAYRPALNGDGSILCRIQRGSVYGVQVYVRDLLSGAGRMESFNNEGVAANGLPYSCSLSGDGSRMVVDTEATNFDPLTEEGRKIILRDLDLSMTYPLTYGRQPQFAPDGKNVCYVADDLLASGRHVYVLDVEAYLDALR